MPIELVVSSLGLNVKMRVSEDKRYVDLLEGVGEDLLATFDLCSVWDMIRDHLATSNAGPGDSPGIFRRKGEAAAAILFTCREYA